VLCNNIFLKQLKGKNLCIPIALKLSFYLFIKKRIFYVMSYRMMMLKVTLILQLIFFLYHQSKMFNPIKDFFHGGFISHVAKNFTS